MRRGRSRDRRRDCSAPAWGGASKAPQPASEAGELHEVPAWAQGLERAERAAEALVRRAVTGDAQVAVGTWLRYYDVRKALDRGMFVASVLTVQTAQFVVLLRPERAPGCFVVASAVLLTHRLVTWQRDGFHYFMVDFCYLANLLCLISALALPHSRALWRVNFALANGPLAWAVVAWSNQLVFHDLDKTVSVWIHLVPALLTYSQRWVLTQSPMCGPAPGEACAAEAESALAVPLAVFAAWQVAYLLVTEVARKHRFEENAELMTSLRWIVRDKGHPVHQLMRLFGLRLKLLGEGEQLDIRTRPALIVSVFVLFQTVYTLLTLLPPLLFFESQALHSLFIVFIALAALWNGAGVYFDLFARRYEAALLASCPDRAAAGVVRLSLEHAAQLYGAHEGVSCDACGRAVTGFRLRCTRCSRHDLCAPCWELLVRSGAAPNEHEFSFAYPDAPQPPPQPPQEQQRRRTSSSSSSSRALRGRGEVPYSGRGQVRKETNVARDARQSQARVPVCSVSLARRTIDHSACLAGCAHLARRPVVNVVACEDALLDAQGHADRSRRGVEGAQAEAGESGRELVLWRAGEGEAPEERGERGQALEVGEVLTDALARAAREGEEGARGRGRCVGGEPAVRPERARVLAPHRGVGLDVDGGNPDSAGRQCEVRRELRGLLRAAVDERHGRGEAQRLVEHGARERELGEVDGGAREQRFERGVGLGLQAPLQLAVLRAVEERRAERGRHRVVPRKQELDQVVTECGHERLGLLRAARRLARVLLVARDHGVEQVAAPRRAARARLKPRARDDQDLVPHRARVAAPLAVVLRVRCVVLAQLGVLRVGAPRQLAQQVLERLDDKVGPRRDLAHAVQLKVERRAPYRAQVVHAHDKVHVHGPPLARGRELAHPLRELQRDARHVRRHQRQLAREERVQHRLAQRAPRLALEDEQHLLAEVGRARCFQTAQVVRHVLLEHLRGVLWPRHEHDRQPKVVDEPHAVLAARRPRAQAQQPVDVIRI